MWFHGRIGKIITESLSIFYYYSCSKKQLTLISQVQSGVRKSNIKMHGQLLIQFWVVCISYRAYLLWSRWGRLISGVKSVRKCQEVLQVAKKDFLDIYRMLITGGRVTESQKTMYRYYLESIIVLQNFQRPGVAEGMTVSWMRLFNLMSWLLVICGSMY